MILRERDPFGFEQVVYHPGSGRFAGSLRDLTRSGTLAVGPPDADAIAGYLSGARLEGRTVLRDYRQLAPGQALLSTPLGPTTVQSPVTAIPGDLQTLLLEALQWIVADTRPTALALSGGLDSALLLSMLHARGVRHIPAYILATGMPGYDERDTALATARRLGADVVVVEVRAQAFVDAIPDAMRHLDEPLYNLHPVAKLLLARAMRRDGIAVAISGDGVDQVMRRDASADYLPLCRTLFQAEGVELAPPFLDRHVVAHLLSLPPDADKACIRRLGQRYGVAQDLIEGPKRSRLAPAMDLDALLPRERIAALAATLCMPPPALVGDAERVHWATLQLLLDDLGAAA
jgi:asparagine synthetase B (glutamine-hydrolysing)